jgi:plasmid maintenance system antidote protein VapI
MHVQATSRPQVEHSGDPKADAKAVPVCRLCDLQRSSRNNPQDVCQAGGLNVDNEMSSGPAQRRLLDSHDHTYASFARKLEVDPKTVERWIFSGRCPYPRTAHKAARLLGVDVFELWPDLYARRQLASNEPATADTLADPPADPDVVPPVLGERVVSELVETMLRLQLTVVDLWTGRHAYAMQTALRMSNEAFAAHLGIAVRTIAKWHAQPDIVQSPDMQSVLDTALTQATEPVQLRFALLLGRTNSAVGNDVASTSNVTDLRLVHTR